MGNPVRIVSLVPSLTELVFWLGGGQRLVGRTRFCIEPAGEVDRVPIVGGTKNPKVERIIELAPDLVLANKEENRREDVEALRAAGLEVLVTDPNTVAEAVATVEDIGALLREEAKAGELGHDVRRLLAESQPPGENIRVFVAIWWNPLMGLGGNTYGHDLLAQSGAANVLSGRSRYPEVTLEEVGALAPDVILLPDEPFPFSPQHAAAFAKVAPVRLVDGKLLWWYGPRIPGAIRELRAMFRQARARP